VRIALAVGVLLFLLTACGGGPDAGEPTLAEALEHEDWLDAYRLMHPGFRQTCTQENFLLVMVFAFAQMQQNFTGDSDIPLDWRVEDVVERGDAGEASSWLSRGGPGSQRSPYRPTGCA
jgi:hypothetical protein